MPLRLPGSPWILSLIQNPHRVFQGAPLTQGRQRHDVCRAGQCRIDLMYLLYGKNSRVSSCFQFLLTFLFSPYVLEESSSRCLAYACCPDHTRLRHQKNSSELCYPISGVLWEAKYSAGWQIKKRGGINTGFAFVCI